MSKIHTPPATLSQIPTQPKQKISPNDSLPLDNSPLFRRRLARSCFEQPLKKFPGVTCELSPPMMSDPMMIDFVAKHVETALAGSNKDGQS